MLDVIVSDVEYLIGKGYLTVYANPTAYHVVVSERDSNHVEGLKVARIGGVATQYP